MTQYAVDAELEGTTILYFTHPTSQPCMVFDAIMAKVASEFKTIRVLTVDPHAHRPLCTRESVLSIPELVAYKDGKRIDQLYGQKGKPETRAFFEGLL